MDTENLVVDDELSETIKKLLERAINPALAADGGWVHYHGHDEGIVYLEMGGGCQGCAIATTSTMAGMRRILMERVEGLKDVVDITDHNTGENPFYITPPQEDG
jgi:Fe-S cluster biogenesis protein NfuA